MVSTVVQDDQLRLLNTYEVMRCTGLSYTNALAFLRVHGVRIGRRFFITVQSLQMALSKQHN